MRRRSLPADRHRSGDPGGRRRTARCRSAAARQRHEAPHISVRQLSMRRSTAGSSPHRSDDWRPPGPRRDI